MVDTNCARKVPTDGKAVHRDGDQPGTVLRLAKRRRSGQSGRVHQPSAPLPAGSNDLNSIPESTVSAMEGSVDRVNSIDGAETGFARRVLLTRALPISVVVAVGLGLPVVAAAATTVGITDVEALEAAAGLESLMLTLYQGMLALPVLTGASPLPALVQLLTVISGHHADHLQAVQEAAQRLDRSASGKPDPRYQPIVTAALAEAGRSNGPASLEPVLRVAAALENVLASSYVSQVRVVRNTGTRRLAASISGVEAQHESSLLLLQSLAKSGDLARFTIGPGAATLPAAAVQAGVPQAVYPTVGAVLRPAGTGS